MEQSATCNGSIADESIESKSKIMTAQRSEMTCREFVELIPAYRDGELSSDDRRSFSQHTRECARCSDYLRGYELTVSAALRSREDSADGNETVMPESLVRRIMGLRLNQRSHS